jgi:diacylglycerol kinase family enzyme
MKNVKVLHNPEAGEGEHSRKKLISQIETAGFDCSYSSTKEADGEKLVPKKFDFVVLAGGDGTVRRIAEEILDKTLLDKRQPIGLLPCGTANNIARTLGIHGSTEEIIARWNNDNVKKFDVGKIADVKNIKFFLEAFGYGVFPRLMKEMKKRDKRSDDPEEELETALKFLHKIVLSYKAKSCKITADSVTWTGNYILVEVMNTRSIGPNLTIATNADPGDGEFDLVLVDDTQREALADYVTRRIKHGKDEVLPLKSIRVKKLQLEWEGAMAHADDVLIDLDRSTKLKLEILPGVLEFLI